MIREGAAPRTRLTPTSFVLLAVVLVLGASAAALLVVDRAGEAIISERERAEAIAERDLLEEVAQEQGRDAAVQSVARRARFASGGAHYGLFADNGAALAGDLTRFEPAMVDADWRPIAAGAGALRVVGVRLPDGLNLVIGRDDSEIVRFERAIAWGFAIALSIVLTAGLAIGMMLNALILQRISLIAGTAERIAAGDLSARAPMADTADPFGRISTSLNAMLSRIEDLMTGMRTVTDSLAHDLRSPLTRSRSALERAMDPAAGPAVRLDEIEAAHGEIDRTLGYLSAMLDIARAETGLSRDTLSEVDVAAIARDVAELFAPTIEDAGQTLHLDIPDDPVRMSGHEGLLRQAVGNLLHNAALHAGNGADVVLEVIARPDATLVIVSDTGPGVPDDQLGRVQERFVRLDPARSAAGSGLGLSIVAACAKLHGGSLKLSSNSPGLRAEITLAT